MLYKSEKSIYNRTMKDKRYYVVITPFFPTQEKFYGVYIYDQVKALQRCDKNVLVLRPYDVCRSSKMHGYELDDIRVEYFPTISTPSYILNGLTDCIAAPLFRMGVSNILGKDVVVEAIHCHTLDCAIFGIELKKIHSNAKLIIQHHDLDPYTLLNGRYAEKKWNINYKVWKAVGKFSKFDVHVSVSNRVEDNLCTFPLSSVREHYSKYKEILKKVSLRNRQVNIKKSLVLYNGVDMSKFYQLPKQANGATSYNIGCIGNYVEIKNHKMLVDAVLLLLEGGYDNVKLYLVGENPKEAFENLKKYVEKKNLKQYVEFVPSFSHSDLIKFYNGLDLFVLPSEFEGLGCVYLESYACGTPFIGVKDQGIDDLIPACDKGKWLIDQMSAENLSDKIKDVMINKYKQRLSVDIDINRLISDFLREIELI